MVKTAISIAILAILTSLTLVPLTAVAEHENCLKRDVRFVKGEIYGRLTLKPIEIRIPKYQRTNEPYLVLVFVKKTMRFENDEGLEAPRVFGNDPPKNITNEPRHEFAVPLNAVYMRRIENPNYTHARLRLKGCVYRDEKQKKDVVVWKVTSAIVYLNSAGSIDYWQNTIDQAWKTYNEKEKVNEKDTLPVIKTEASLEPVDD